jgi:serine/threonine protein kinase
MRRGSRPKAAAGISGPAYSRLQAVAEEQQQDSWGSFSSSRGSGGSMESLPRAAAARPPASRQWGLETDSLRLAPGELQMQTAPDGSLCLLGEGSSSTVYLGRLGGYEDVAVKVIEVSPGMDSRHVWHEVSLLRACVHRRLVALLGVACQGQLLMLVMELMRGGDLHSALRRPDTRDALRWAARGRQVALDVAEALAFLHSCGVQHADLKPSNVMLTGELRAKLTDLGVAQQLGSRSRQAVGGTTQYAAPEQLLGLPCTTKADVYSLGVLLAVLCTGRSLAARGQLCLPTAPGDCPQAVLELIQECICPDPARRPTADEALRRLRDS